MKKLLFFFLFIAFCTLTKAQYKRLVDFAGANGKSPAKNLISDGTYLYGMTSLGGANDSGTVFKVMPDGTGFATILDFNGSNGKNPIASLYYDGTWLFGMTTEGGANHAGVIFKIQPDGSSYTKLLDFDNINGGFPYNALVSDGTYLYGASEYGGTSSFGLVFKIAKDGTGYVDLHDFAGGTTDGSYAFTMATDGTNLYGTTNSGGANGGGVLFKINMNGTGYTKLQEFSGATDGGDPLGIPFYDGSNYLYGMTYQGGANNLGVIYKIKTDGTGYTKLLDFSGPDGQSPYGSVVSDGTYLYGMTANGGANSFCFNGCGTLFKIKTDGTGYEKLMDFDGGLKGNLPEGDVIVIGNYLYGMTDVGGAGGYGTVFKYNLLCHDTTITTSPVICTGQSVTVGTNTYTTSGTFIDTLLSYQGCDSIIITNLTVDNGPTLNITGSFTMCEGHSVNYSASGAVTYLWSTGETTANISVSPAITTSYTVTGTDTNGCYASEYFTLVVGPSTDIIGNLSYSGGNITSGSVFLIAQGTASALYDTIAVVSPDGSGNYVFASAIAGNYYIRAETTIPSVVNTYFGNDYLWDSSTVMNHGCGMNDVADITMIELPVLSGSAKISGTVIKGTGFGQKIIPGNPVPFTNVIPGVPTKVGRNPSGTIVASTVTDSNGVYTFANLPVDDYTIYVDMPGYPMDSTYHVSITSGSDSVVNLDYIVDSNSVYIDLTTSTQTNVNAKYSEAGVQIFPNPVHDHATFVFEINEYSNVKFDMYTLQGEKIAALLNRNFEKGKYSQTINFDQHIIADGIYMIKVMVNDNVYVVRMMVRR